jgi:predicted ATPase
VSAANLAGILDLLKDTEPERWKGLNEELERWFPEFDQILFDRNDDGKYIVLRTKLGKHKIKAKDLSDGTRLALAYLTLAYLPNPPKIVAFEEPERGIHPRLLENIQEAMYRLAYPENYGEKREPIQVIATTHSPYLLDLYKDYPEEIVIASKNENGVHFERLIDQPYYEKVIQDAPLGEVWFTGVLGGVPVQP